MGVPAPAAASERQILGRYVLFDQIASGGMASVHYGRMRGSVGFARSVAVKRLHPHLAADPDFVAMFLDEARLAARIHHSNVVDTLDVVTVRNDIILVMEYVHGESLSMLLKSVRRDGTVVPPAIAAAIVSGLLHGLHAAHEAVSEQGEALDIVHRDVSPQNVIVGVDGIARVLDFGVAKALTRTQVTREGELKGKLAYMAPEQLRRGKVDRRTDIYAATVVLWETLTAERLHDADDEGGLVASILESAAEPPSAHVADISPELDAVVMRGLSVKSDDRFPTALAMADALEMAISPARPREVGEWVNSVAKKRLAQRAERLAAIERIDLGAEESSGPEDLVANAASSRESATMRLEEELSRVKAVDVPGPNPSVTTVLVPQRRVPAASRRSRILVALAFSVGSFAIAVLALALFLRHLKARPAELAAEPVPEASSAEVASPSSVPEPSSVALPATSGSSAPVVAASSSARRVVPSPHGKRPANADRCDPPFYIDADGVKRFKAKCL